MSRLHDEPSRALRIFPGRRAGESAFTLYEDDGLTRRHLDGEQTLVECRLEWTPNTVCLKVTKQGDYALPYRKLRVVLPPGERRPLRLSGVGIALEAA